MKTILVLVTALFATSTIACVGGGEGAKCMAIEPTSMTKQLPRVEKKLSHAKIIITKKEASKYEQTDLGPDVHDNVLSGGVS